MSSSDHKAAAGAVGGKAARACDSCMRRRARWYCAADDAFLCQACDTSVHSANPLARRHERLRLRPSSSVLPPPPQSVKKGMAATAMSNRQVVAPGWTKRKARTRRPQVKSVGQLLSRRLVPEMAVESSSSEEPKEAEELLYHVPIFNPAFGDYHSPPSVDDTAAADSCRREDADGAVEITPSPVQQLPDNSFASFGPTDMEALLGQGLEDSLYMETLGLLSPSSEGSGRVKVEADRAVSKSWGAPASGPELKPELSDEVLDVDFNCSSSSGDAVDTQFLKRSLDLRLNYDTIIDNWGSSPWTDGRRPHVQLDDFLVHHHTGMWMAGGGRQGVVAGTPRPMIDGAREARVSRYREKRRTRLFAKKICYEVRKLNAEKRPRMKGRFVKRPAGGATCAVT